MQKFSSVDQQKIHWWGKQTSHQHSSVEDWRQRWKVDWSWRRIHHSCCTQPYLQCVSLLLFLFNCRCKRCTWTMSDCLMNYLKNLLEHVTAVSNEDAGPVPIHINIYIYAYFFLFINLEDIRRRNIDGKGVGERFWYNEDIYEGNLKIPAVRRKGVPILQRLTMTRLTSSFEAFIRSTFLLEPFAKLLNITRAPLQLIQLTS